MPSFSDDQQVTTLLGSIDDTITAEVVAGAVQVSPFGESIVVEPSPRVQIDAVEGLLSTDVETYTDGVSGSTASISGLEE